MTPKMHISNAPAMAVFSEFPRKTVQGKAAARDEVGLKMALSATVLGLLIASLPGSSLAQSGNNMWNPFPNTQTQSAPVQPPVAMPKYYGDAPVAAAPTAPSAQTHSDMSSPNRFAPPGLNQQLSSGPYTQPGFSQIAPQSGPIIGYQEPASQENYPSTNGQGGPAFYPQGYNNGFNGYGSNNSYNSFGNPGGYGGYAPYPGNNNGNNTGGGFPGFNFSPFGFF